MSEPIAPSSGAGDNPQPGAAGALAGQAGGTPGAQPGAGADNPAGAGTFDAAAYLATLPEDERAHMAQLPSALLERHHQRTMLRSTFDRNRGQDREQLRTREGELEALKQQNLALQTILERTAGGTPPENGNGQPAGPADPAELSQKLFETNDPQEYHQSLAGLVQHAVAETLSKHPVLRQVSTGIALRQARGGVEGATDSDFARGEQLMDQAFRSQGVDPMNMDPKVIQFLAPYFTRLGKAESALQQGGAGAAGGGPALSAGGRAALPPSGTGPALPSADPAAVERQKAFTEGSLDDRIRATLMGKGMTPGDMARLTLEGGM